MVEAAQFNQGRAVEGAPAQHLPASVLDAFRKHALLRTLASNERLYAEGEPRSHVYLIEDGAIWLHALGTARSSVLIEIASLGDLVGMGYLETHSATAQAIGATTVLCCCREDFAKLAATEPYLKAKQDLAIEKEFAARRSAVTDLERAPLQRVAAFLVAVSRKNLYEGMDPTWVAETFKCGPVGSILSLDAATLASALLELQSLGLIEPATDSSLRLRDLTALERLIDSPGFRFSSHSGTQPETVDPADQVL